MSHKGESVNRAKGPSSFLIVRGSRRPMEPSEPRLANAICFARRCETGSSISSSATACCTTRRTLAGRSSGSPCWHAPEVTSSSVCTMPTPASSMRLVARSSDGRAALPAGWIRTSGRWAPPTSVRPGFETSTSILTKPVTRSVNSSSGFARMVSSSSTRFPSQSGLPIRRRTPTDRC